MSEYTLLEGECRHVNHVMQHMTDSNQSHDWYQSYCYPDVVYNVDSAQTILLHINTRSYNMHSTVESQLLATKSHCYNLPGKWVVRCNRLPQCRSHRLWAPNTIDLIDSTIVIVCFDLTALVIDCELDRYHDRSMSWSLIPALWSQLSDQDYSWQQALDQTQAAIRCFGCVAKETSLKEIVI